jgi:hypothetical protein
MGRRSERQRETENVRKGRKDRDVRDLESWVTMGSCCLCESLYANTMCKAATRAGMDHRRTHPPKSSRDSFALFPLPSFTRGWGLPVRLSRSFGSLLHPPLPPPPATVTSFVGSNGSFSSRAASKRLAVCCLSGTLNSHAASVFSFFRKFGIRIAC